MNAGVCGQPARYFVFYKLFKSIVYNTGYSQVVTHPGTKPVSCTIIQSIYI